MADQFRKRTVVPNRHSVLGFGRIKKLIGVMHWVQEFYRANNIPTTRTSRWRSCLKRLALVRKSDLEFVGTNSEAADPGRFKDKRKWPEWEKAFTPNYPLVLPGASRITFYIVRKRSSPMTD